MRNQKGDWPSINQSFILKSAWWLWEQNLWVKESQSPFLFLFYNTLYIRTSSAMMLLYTTQCYKTFFKDSLYLSLHEYEKDLPHGLHKRNLSFSPYSSPRVAQQHLKERRGKQTVSSITKYWTSISYIRIELCSKISFFTALYDLLLILFLLGW